MEQMGIDLKEARAGAKEKEPPKRKVMHKV
jgi:hypothetical protein